MGCIKNDTKGEGGNVNWRKNRDTLVVLEYYSSHARVLTGECQRSVSGLEISSCEI